MAKELKVVGKIKINDEIRDFESLSESERATVEATWSKRLSDSMSLYYSAHREEYVKTYEKPQRKAAVN